MATLSKEPISGSTDGLPIRVSGTNDAGKVLLHTADTLSGNCDFLDIDVHVDDAQTDDVTLTLSLDDGTDPDDLIHTTIGGFGTAGSDGIIPILRDFALKNGKAIYAYASAADALMITGRRVRHAE